MIENGTTIEKIANMLNIDILEVEKMLNASEVSA